MEEYNEIYPKLPKAERDGGRGAGPKAENFRLQKSCEVLEKLEKEAKHYTGVKKKIQKNL